GIGRHGPPKCPDGAGGEGGVSRNGPLESIIYFVILTRAREVAAKPFYLLWCWTVKRSPTPVHRILAVFLAAAMSLGVMAADKAAPKARVSKASQTVEVDDQGGPFLKSSGALVLDAATG